MPNNRSVTVKGSAARLCECVGGPLELEDGWCDLCGRYTVAPPMPARELAPDPIVVAAEAVRKQLAAARKKRYRERHYDRVRESERRSQAKIRERRRRLGLTTDGEPVKVEAAQHFKT